MNKNEKINKEIITLIKFRIQEKQFYRFLIFKYKFKNFLECPDNFGIEYEYCYESYLQCLEDLKGIDDELTKLIKKRPKFFINFYNLACKDELQQIQDDIKNIDDKTASKIIDLLTDLYEKSK